jgi:hypothetical protein
VILGVAFQPISDVDAANVGHHDRREIGEGAKDAWQEQSPRKRVRPADLRGGIEGHAGGRQEEKTQQGARRTRKAGEHQRVLVGVKVQPAERRAQVAAAAQVDPHLGKLLAVARIGL